MPTTIILRCVSTLPQRITLQSLYSFNISVHTNKYLTFDLLIPLLHILIYINLFFKKNLTIFKLCVSVNLKILSPAPFLSPKPQLLFICFFLIFFSQRVHLNYLQLFFTCFLVPLAWPRLCRTKTIFLILRTSTMWHIHTNDIHYTYF